MKAYLPTSLLTILALCTTGTLLAEIHADGVGLFPVLVQVVVIGKLGKPLGEAVAIEGIIVAGDETRMKTYQGSYLLKIVSVEGKPLAQPPLMEFSIPGFVNVPLANTSFSLFKLKTGRTAGSLDDAQVRKIEQGYVGATFRLLAYETGGFRCIPRHLPQDLLWQDRGFGFSTHLVLLKDLTDKATPQR